MKDIETAGTWQLGDKCVTRMGYGAMQLASKGAFGEPRDRDGAMQKGTGCPRNRTMN
ncbi:hypothetical protein [Marivivens donghaensis]|uniref:hypothetical protein n=1 Tax=Marivivens donghaensis TaxID=1699413 RepID=UPI002483DBBA|nr:hypothetical protein [Marivivens donghaensis]